MMPRLPAEKTVSLVMKPPKVIRARPPVCQTQQYCWVLQDFRLRHNLTQAMAAQWTNAPKRTWEGWESGDPGRLPPRFVLMLLSYIDRYGLIHYTPPDDRMESRSRLRKFRSEHNLEAEEAAALIKVSPRCWEAWEREARLPVSCLWPLLTYFDEYGLDSLRASE